MTPESESQREERAQALREEAENRRVQLAVERALFDASITKQLSEHQAHLLTINGSIDENVKITETLVRKVDRLDELEREREVEADKGRVAAAANTSQKLSSKQWRIGLAVVILAVILGQILSQAHPF